MPTRPMSTNAAIINADYRPRAARIASHATSVTARLGSIFQGSGPAYDRVEYASLMSNYARTEQRAHGQSAVCLKRKPTAPRLCKARRPAPRGSGSSQYASRTEDDLKPDTSRSMSYSPVCELCDGSLLVCLECLTRACDISAERLS